MLLYFETQHVLAMNMAMGVGERWRLRGPNLSNF